ncbi:oxidative stress-induced growth inhibitor 2-like [Tubulanus polymorphus]|uniref:oxidative stress-induced growth inhibitor 2-like n=1 Tax=Tubulanus polymorphus TaxID=672921 RepID=UPI003DA47B78
MKNVDITTTDVIIIGNGPSAISLSYLLSGNWPYYNGNPVPNEYLQYKLDESNLENVSIIEQDLEYLAEGLEGRSTNPIALLFDTLYHPNADLGMEDPSAVTWKHDSSHIINHMVLGKGPPGGVWQTLEGGIQTVSLGNWMELPDMPFKEWSTQYRKSRDLVDGKNIIWNNEFASTDEVGQYYMDYIKNKGISNRFYSFHTVTSVCKVQDSKRLVIDGENGEITGDINVDKNFIWEVCGQKIVIHNCDKDPEIEDFCYRAMNVVLATGSSDTPNRLEIVGENLPFVMHSMKELEHQIIDGSNTRSSSESVVVIGAGLTAADAVLYSLEAKLNVIHVFRREANDPMLIFNKLPMSMYPQYHRVHRLMRGIESSDRYTPYANCKVNDILPDGRIVLTSEDSCDIMLEVSHVVVTIGARPNLSFLNNEGRNLGIVPGDLIDSKNNLIDIDLISYESVNEPGLFAIGPLVGDNFVRFLLGGSLAITSHLWKNRRLPVGRITTL